MFQDFHRRVTGDGGLAGELQNQHRGDGIDRGLLDSTLRNPGRGGHTCLPGQRAPCAQRAWTQIGRERLTVAAIIPNAVKDPRLHLVISEQAAILPERRNAAAPRITFTGFTFGASAILSLLGSSATWVNRFPLP